jgi:glycosyltransferase involved in cell wall biosynthesis
MKLLLVSNYYDGTGYAHAAIDFILALDAAGVDVVCRPVSFESKHYDVPPRIKELEAKTTDGCKVCIQYTLPNYMHYNGRFDKCIGMYDSETSNFKSSNWAYQLNMMDEVWVVNQQMKEAAIASGVIKPIKVIPHPCDTSKFERAYDAHPAIKPFKERGDFVFYTISEMNKRKNVVALIKAFHYEFDYYEPVQLALKLSKPGKSAEETRGGIEAMCQEVKGLLKINDSEQRYFKKEIILTNRLSDEGMYSLHSTCDCFVSSSFGEAWCIPAFDALGFGKTPIAPGWAGFLEYLDNDVGRSVQTHQKPVYGIDETFPDLYTGNETWAEPDILDLRRAMREAFENQHSNHRKIEAGLERAYQFSYQEVGEKMRQALS